jgi:hypothetical protein
MRLWSLHPKYLDAKGLVAAWRESLLAKKVLEGKTNGYRNHPQLIRFKNYHDPGKAINTYLVTLLEEARQRGYNFDRGKISQADVEKVLQIEVTSGQIEYEYRLLQQKIKARSPREYNKFQDNPEVQPNRIFKIVPGGIADWERVKGNVRNNSDNSLPKVAADDGRSRK